MSEYTDRLVQQTEAMLHFRHDETLTETSPERLHEALSDKEAGREVFGMCAGRGFRWP